jgi:molecular chaperone DnaK (HSP70)
LTSEPEAAALACENSMHNIEELGEGQTMLICDEGGGTIDIAAYRVSYKSGRQNLEGLTRGHGQPCGLDYIDDLAKLWIHGHLEKYKGILPEDLMAKLCDEFINEKKVGYIDIKMIKTDTNKF